jgi:hypothetical protein
MGFIASCKKEPRTFILLLHLVCFNCLGAYGQPCRQAQPENQLRSDIIEGFVFQSEQAYKIKGEKGVVCLFQHTDTLGREVWTFTTIQKEDEFKRNDWIPRSYYLFKGYPVLVYQQQYRHQPLDLQQKKEIYDCLNDLFAHRLIPTPSPRYRVYMQSMFVSQFRPVYDANGYPVRKFTLYRMGEDMIGCCLGCRPFRIRFEKDGSVTRI